MYIKELKLTSFGKFKDKSIAFQNGLNVVHGDNEAGKSTIHNFMEMMLYGFKNSTKEDSVELFKKYRPWFNKGYEGKLSISKDGKTYSVLRDFNTDEKKFTKCEEKAFGSLEMPDAEKYDELGEHLFGINKKMYTNTLSIKQLGNSTDEELAQELKNRIWNFGQTKDETISVTSLIKKLDSMKNEYGSSKDENSLLGQYKLRIKNLNSLRKEIIADKDKISEYADQKIDSSKKLIEIDERLTQINFEIENYETLSLVKKKIQIDKIIDNLEVEREKMQEISGAKDITVSDYENAVKLITILEQMKSQKDTIEVELNKTKLELEALTSKKEYNLNLDGVVVNINLDYVKYISNEEKLNSIQNKVNLGQRELETYDVEKFTKFDAYIKEIKFINNHLDEISKKEKESANQENDIKIDKAKNAKKGFIALTVVSFAVAAISGYLIAAENINFYLGLVAVIPGIIGLIKVNGTNKKIKRLISIKERSDKENENAEERKAEYKDKLDKVLEKSKSKNLEELINKCNSQKTIEKEYENKVKLLNYDISIADNFKNNQETFKEDLLSRLTEFGIYELSDLSIENMNAMMVIKKDLIAKAERKMEVIEGLNKQYEKAENEYNYENGRFEIILKSNDIKNVEEFKKQTNNSYKIIQIRSNIEGYERTKENLLDDMTYEELSEKVDSTRDYMKNVTISDMKSKENELKILNENRNEVSMELDNIDNQILSIEIRHKKLVEVDEEIEFYYNRAIACKEKLEIIEITKKNILLISDYIKGDFMPILRRAISENFSFVTDDKYKEVDIDQDMNIYVIDSKNSERIALKSLSGGTLDQLYMSLRLGISSIISNDRDIPLILDDSFIQYDEARLLKSLEILHRESQRRQVIVFTCQKREQVLADKLGLTYNLVSIV